MKKLFLSLVVAAAALMPVGLHAQPVTVARQSKMDFSKIEASGAVNLHVEERTTGNIIIRTTQRMLDCLELAVSDGTLKVRLDAGKCGGSGKRWFNFRNTDDVDIYIPYNGRIGSIELSGAADIDVRPTLKSQGLVIAASGASDVDLAGIEVETLDVVLSGASDMECRGKAASANVAVSGASEFDGEHLLVGALNVAASGASEASAKAARCTAMASGSSEIDVECSEHLTASASGASDIRYKGGCMVDILQNSGMSSIKRD